MGMITRTLSDEKPSEETLQRMAELRDDDIVYDEDCPELSEKMKVALLSAVEQRNASHNHSMECSIMRQKMTKTEAKFEILRTILPSVPLFYKEDHADSRIISYENHAWVCYDVDRLTRTDVFRARSFDQIARKCIIQCYNGDKEQGVRIYEDACGKLYS